MERKGDKKIKLAQNVSPVSDLWMLSQEQKIFNQKIVSSLRASALQKTSCFGYASLVEYFLQITFIKIQPGLFRK